MRTTVDIPEPLYRRLKTPAVREDASVKDLILRGIEQILRENHRVLRGQREPSDHSFQETGKGSAR